MDIPFVDLRTQYVSLQASVKSNIERVLEHGQYIMGPEVNKLEKELQRFSGARNCLTVASGTEALLISMMALDIGVGDEVITTPFTFVATVETIVLLGATPVFVDVESDTCNIDVSKIEASITRKTKAIIPVSLYGQCSDMDELGVLSAKYDIPVIEDAAQSFGAKYNGKRSCNLSKLACTSFFPSKPLGCYGDGGAIFTDDDDLYEICKQIRVHGQSERYVHSRIGVGGRMDTLQCAIVLAKLEYFNDELKARVAIGLEYNRQIDLAKIDRVTQRANRNSVFAQFTVFVKNRDAVQSYLKSQGIPTAVHYPIPLNKQLPYKSFSAGVPTTVSSTLASEVLSLPMSGYLKTKHQNYIVEKLIEAVGQSN